MEDLLRSISICNSPSPYLLLAAEPAAAMVCENQSDVIDHDVFTSLNRIITNRITRKGSLARQLYPFTGNTQSRGKVPFELTSRSPSDAPKEPLVKVGS